MRLKEAIISALLLMFSILGYQHSATIVNDTQKELMSSMTGILSSNLASNHSPYLPQMGYQDIQTMTKIVQYGFGILALLGLGFVVYCIFAKKKSVDQFNSISVKTDPQNTPLTPDNETTKSNIRGLKILKERLARGEITKKDFGKLKRFFE